MLAPAHGHVAPGFQMHLDAMGVGAIQREVAPVAHVEVSTQQAVQVAQHVQVERRRHAERVVVGGFQPARILDEVDADQHAVPASGSLAQALEEGQRFCRREVAETRARIEPDAAPIAHSIGQHQRRAQVRANADHRQLRMLPRQRAQRAAQEVGGDVDRHVARRRQRAEQAYRLLAIAGAQVDERCATPDAQRDLGGMLAEDGGFRAGRVVLGQIGNRLEQPGAERIVEEFRAHAGRGRQQARLCLGTQGRVVLHKELVESQARADGLDRRLRLDQTGQHAAGIGIGGRLGGLHGVSRWGWNGTVQHRHEGHWQREMCHGLRTGEFAA